jgi:TonB family protein
MASAPPSPPPAFRRERVVPIAVGLGLVAIFVALILWLWPTGGNGIARERVIQQITVVQPPPPPPPPVPEEKIMEEQEIVQPTDKPQVAKVDTPAPDKAPSDAPPAPSSDAPAGLDHAADAGSDSFRLASGGGGGLFGRGGGGGGGIGWGRFVEAHIQRALQRDARTRAASGSVRVTVNIDATGRFVGAALRSSSGDNRLDAAIRDVLSSLPPLGRSRPADQNGLTDATITMKRTDG